MGSKRQQVWILFALIAALAYFTGSVFASQLPAWWPAKNTFDRYRPHLGLDLQGGAHLIYEADTSQVTPDEAESAMEGVRDVIERRVNALGVSEPVVQTAKVDDRLRIIVELAGVFDVNEAIAQIGATPLLEFKKQAVPPEPVAFSAEEKREREEFNVRQLAKANQALEEIKAVNRANFAEKATEVSEDPGSAAAGGDLGFLRRDILDDNFAAALFDELKDGEITDEPVRTDFGYHIIERLESRTETDDVTNEAISVVHARHILFRTQLLAGRIPEYDPWENTGLGGQQLVRSQVQFDDVTGAASVGLQFNEEGDKLFESLTEQNIGKQLAIFLDGLIISAPVVQQKIAGGQAVITGSFTIPEARELVERLNAGALPVPINLVSQQTVGPTLGALSVARSVVAGLWGFALVALFMLLIYRLSGVVAIFALGLYATIVFTLLQLIPVTLTLAGIAGFLLSVGMAVDANVLIFERLREELRNGRDFINALKEAFARAWPSIRDSNVSTLITCLILAWFGTSVVKGFAITLGLGVLISMFSAIIVTRILLEILGKTKFLRDKTWLWGK